MMMQEIANTVVSLRGQVLPVEDTRAVVLRFYLGRKNIEQITLSSAAALLLYRDIKAYLRKGHCRLPSPAGNDVTARRLNELNSHYADITGDDLVGIANDEIIVAEIDPIPDSDDLLLQPISRSAEIKGYRLDVFAVHAIVAVLELCLVGSLKPFTPSLH